MLILRAADEGEPVTIVALAHELLIKHNSAVGLVDRLVLEGLATREASSADRRKVELRLSARGRAVLAQLAAVHRAELQRIGPALKRVIAQVSRK
jgi:DNA-binding MarR family transcriptional regulator